jgi:Putative esterase
MHGAGMNTDSFLAGPGQRSALKTMLDHMLGAEEIKPLIVVTPFFYPDANSSMDLHYAGQLDRDFHQELEADLMPAVEARYHTYAETTDTAGFRASRTHRGFAGFSMGGVTTWYTFINSLDYFKYFLPMAGDCWVIEDVGGARAPEETAAYLARVARGSGYDRGDYLIAASVGSSDGTISQMQPQLDAMRQLTDSFDAGNDGNLRFITDPVGGHDFASLYRQFERSIRLFV